VNAPRTLVLSLAFASLSVLGGCIIGSSSKTETEGVYVGSETVAQITPGSSQGYVLALLGEPTAKVEIGDGRTLWKWRHVERRKSSGSLLLVFSADNEHKSTSTAYVEFVDGKVVKAWRD
jgi:outer membrane protein assembly factor BamE (lipoprotein component of BamABCDE complex)